MRQAHRIGSVRPGQVPGRTVIAAADGAARGAGVCTQSVSQLGISGDYRQDTPGRVIPWRVAAWRRVASGGVGWRRDSAGAGSAPGVELCRVGV